MAGRVWPLSGQFDLRHIVRSCGRRQRSRAMTHICSDKAPSPLPLSASLRSSLTPLSISLVDQSSYHSRKVFLSHATNANLPLRNMSSGCCPSESSDDERCSGEICDGTHANVPAASLCARPNALFAEKCISAAAAVECRAACDHEALQGKSSRVTLVPLLSGTHQQLSRSLMPNNVWQC